MKVTRIEREHLVEVHIEAIPHTSVGTVLEQLSVEVAAHLDPSAGCSDSPAVTQGLVARSEELYQRTGVPLVIIISTHDGERLKPEVVRALRQELRSVVLVLVAGSYVSDALWIDQANLALLSSNDALDESFCEAYEGMIKYIWEQYLRRATN